MPLRESSYGVSCAQSKLTIRLISVVHLRTDRFLNSEYTHIFPCLRITGVGVLWRRITEQTGELMWPSGWGPTQPAEA